MNTWRQAMMGRDYSEDLTITLEWSEWTHIWALASETVRQREEDCDWPDEATERDREVVEALSQEISEENPGNGIDDWPDSMKEAFDETMAEMLEERL